jgi:hypothetical protein
MIPSEVPLVATDTQDEFEGTQGGRVEPRGVGGTVIPLATCCRTR